MAKAVVTKKNIWEIADKAEIGKLLKTIKKKKLLKEQLENEIKEAENIIKGLMDECDETELVCGVFKVKYISMNTTRFDSKTFKEENPALYDRYAKKIPTRRFTLQ